MKPEPQPDYHGSENSGLYRANILEFIEGPSHIRMKAVNRLYSVWAFVVRLILTAVLAFFDWHLMAGALIIWATIPIEWIVQKEPWKEPTPGLHFDPNINNPD